MLKSISWSQFAVCLFLATLAYYFYVTIRFYRREIKDFLTGKKTTAGPSGAGKATSGQPEAAQGTIFSDAPTKEETEGAELFKVMEHVVGLLKSVVAEAVSTRITRDELLSRIRQVLSNYHHLRKSPYEVAINNFLVRTCASNFSLPLSDDDVAGLWR
jgi:hypothetical protein